MSEQDESEPRTLNAVEWATKFNAIAQRLGYSSMDEGWLIGWFANAIERGKDRGRADAQAEHGITAYLARQRDWSRETFGPTGRLLGIVDHIRKELLEIEAMPQDVREWVDVAILALDGAWRTGAEPEDIAAELHRKFAENARRTWPDWRTADPDRAIEHVREPVDAQAEHDAEMDAARDLGAKVARLTEFVSTHPHFRGRAGHCSIDTAIEFMRAALGPQAEHEQQVREAVLREREECALVVIHIADEILMSQVDATEIVAAIRARSTAQGEGTPE